MILKWFQYVTFCPFFRKKIHFFFISRSKGNIEATFLHHEGFLGALGALTSYENIDLEDLIEEHPMKQVCGFESKTYYTFYHFFLRVDVQQIRIKMDKRLSASWLASYFLSRVTLSKCMLVD